MTLAELTQKIEQALQDNTPFVEQVKVTLQVVAEQLNTLKTLDGYYNENYQSLTQLTANNKQLVEQATELLEKVEQSRAEAEAIVNARIDGLNVNYEYKTLIKIPANRVVIYAGELYVSKSEFIASSWKIDKEKLIKQGSSASSGGASVSNAYAESKVITKGELITHEGKIYIALENFTATNWVADESKFVEYNTGAASNPYAEGQSITKGAVYTYENKLYVALESFISTNWESDKEKFVEYTSDLGVNLDNYYTKEQIDLLLNGKCDLLTAGDGIEVKTQDGNIIVGVKDYNKITSDIAEIAKTINTGLTTIGKHIFSIQIDTTKIGTPNVEPAEYLKATDEAKGASEAQIEAWMGHYPCILSPEGLEFKKLKKTNYAQFDDGGDASSYIITLGNDVMVTQPLRGYRLRRLSTNICELSMTDDTNAVGFNFNAFRDGAELKDCYYEGAYKGFVSGGKLYSTHNQYPAVNAALGTFRNYAAARGAGYRLINYEQLKFRQARYLLIHQDLNSQRKIGKGWSSMSGSAKTGTTNAWGFNSEIIKASNPTYLTDGKHQVKVDGLEDAWGNVCEWIDGFLLVGTKLTISTGNFNDAGLGYTDIGYAFAGRASGQNIASVAWDNERGFYPTQVGGDNEAYFTDVFWQASVSALISGYAWFDGSRCGVFAVSTDMGAGNSEGHIAARLVKM